MNSNCPLHLFSYQAKWSDPRFQGPSLVNQNAQFPLDYHIKKKLDNLQSKIFDQPPKIYTQAVPAKRNQPLPQKDHKKRATLSRQSSTHMKNYKGLFDLQTRQPLGPLQKAQKLISNDKDWTNQQRKGWQVDHDKNYHKKRYSQNMKSCMDSHRHYEKKQTSAQPPPVFFKQQLNEKQNVKVNSRPTSKAPPKPTTKPLQKQKTKTTKPAAPKLGLKSSNKSIKIKIKQGWKLLDLQTLQKILTDNKLLSLCPENQQLRVEVDSSQITDLLRKFKQEGITAIRL